MLGSSRRLPHFPGKPREPHAGRGASEKGPRRGGSAGRPSFLPSFLLRRLPAGGPGRRHHHARLARGLLQVAALAGHVPAPGRSGGPGGSGGEAPPGLPRGSPGAALGCGALTAGLSLPAPVHGLPAAEGPDGLPAGALPREAQPAAGLELGLLRPLRLLPRALPARLDRLPAARAGGGADLPADHARHPARLPGEPPLSGHSPTSPP